MLVTVQGVLINRTFGAAVSHDTSHVSAVSTSLRWIFKNALWKASPSCRITCQRSESAQEWRIALYKSDQTTRSELQHEANTRSGVGLVFLILAFSVFPFLCCRFCCPVCRMWIKTFSVFCLFCLFEKYVHWEGIQRRSHREERNICWWCLSCSEHLFCLWIPMGWVYIALWSTRVSWKQLVVLCALWCLCGHNVCEERCFL